MEKLKSFYEWYFKDSIKISSPSLDVGSKRLGKLLTILVVGGWGLFVIWWGFFGRSYKVLWFDPVEAIIGLGFLLLVVIGGWILYRGFRMLFWVVDGFRNPKE